MVKLQKLNCLKCKSYLALECFSISARMNVVGNIHLGDGILRSEVLIRRAAKAIYAEKATLASTHARVLGRFFECRALSASTKNEWRAQIKHSSK